jgi:hypothetical protein
MTIANDLLRKTTGLEHMRRVRSYLQSHRRLLVAGGAGKRELKTLDESILYVDGIIRSNDLYPLDAPDTVTAPRSERPLCPPGEETWMLPFIAELAGEPA